MMSFNPRADKENQGHPKFIQLKAKFVTGRDSFVFLEELAAPLEEAPRFLKASKQDKVEQRKKTPPTNTIKKKLVPKPKLARASKASA